MVTASVQLSAPDAAHRVRTLLVAGRWRAAVAVASRSLRAGETAELRLLRARALLAFRADDAAARDLRRCLALEPARAVAHQLLCELALRRGDLAGAERSLVHAVRLAPTDRRTAELRAVVVGWRRACPARRDAGETTDRRAA